MKRILCFLLVAMMALGCGAALAESPFTADNPGQLTVAVYDRSNMDTSYGDATDNYWANWIKEQVLADLNIEITFMAMSRSDSGALIPVWMAGGNCPDIFFTYSASILYDYAEQGGLYELSDLIAEYAPTLSEELADTLSFGYVSGGQYAIPARRGNLAHISAFIRKDWCDAIGYDLSYDEDGNAWISYDELQTVMTAWKEQGICETPMALLQENSTAEAESMDPFTNAFIDYEAITEQDIATLPVILWPGVKDGYAWLNKLYNEGLIQPDWAIYSASDETEWKSWISNGNVGVWSHAYWRELSKNESIETLYANDPTADLIAINITNADGVAAMVDRYAPNGMFIMVPAYSQHAAEAVLYLDWLTEYEHFEYLAYGIEGEHYILNDDGVHDTTDAKADAITRISVGDLALTYNGDPTPGMAISEQAFAVSTAMRPIYMSAYYASLKHTYEPYDFGETIVAMGDYGSSLNEKINEVRVKSITCLEADFDSTYDTLVNEFLGMGGQAVIDEKTEVYTKKEAAQ